MNLLIMEMPLFQPTLFSFLFFFFSGKKNKIARQKKTIGEKIGCMYVFSTLQYFITSFFSSFHLVT